MDSNGLTIKAITQADNGQYTCRAEVKSEGRYDERKITVTVHSQYPDTIYYQKFNTVHYGI